MFRPSLFMYGYSGQQCCVKDVSSIFVFIMKQKVSTPRKEPGKTHTSESEFSLWLTPLRLVFLKF